MSQFISRVLRSSCLCLVATWFFQVRRLSKWSPRYLTVSTWDTTVWLMYIGGQCPRRRVKDYRLNCNLYLFDSSAVIGSCYWTTWISMRAIFILGGRGHNLLAIWYPLFGYGVLFFKLHKVLFKKIVTSMTFLENIVYRVEQILLTICVQQHVIVVSSCLFADSSRMILSS